MSGRTIAIGDIHGCGKALRTLIEEIAPGNDDTIVFLGDYIDRGPDSRDVIDQVIALKSSTNVVHLFGNHEIMFLAVAAEKAEAELWDLCGGKATLNSYGGSFRHVPESHFDFFRSCRKYWEDDRNIYVHANYLPNKSMDELDEQTMFWEHLSPVIPGPHQSGKRVIVGHTPQPTHEILDKEHLVCIDTYCFGGGWLTAYDVDTGEIWQANYHGHLRRFVIPILINGCKRIWNRLRGDKG